MLVKVPYFPNWHATGALGPYEVSPNLMAVVPTAHHVTFTYGTTGADQLGKLASLGGVVGLGMLMTLHPPVMRQPARHARAAGPRRRATSPTSVTWPSRSEDEGRTRSRNRRPGARRPQGTGAGAKPGPEAAT